MQESMACTTCMSRRSGLSSTEQYLHDRQYSPMLSKLGMKPPFFSSCGSTSDFLACVSSTPRDLQVGDLISPQVIK